MNAGRSAAAMRPARRLTSAGSGAGPVPVHTSTAGTSPLDGPNTSSGKSRNVGPRCGVRLSVAASCTSAPARVASFTVRALLVMLCTTGTWSISCNDPAPHRPSGARPPITTTGEPLNHALVMADTPLVMPGPAVSAAKPGLRVSLA